MNETPDLYTLYGDARSGNCYKAAQILRLTGRPFEWVETDVVAGEARTPEFLKLNPNAKVPLLILPDGRLLSESNAMLIYLSDGTRFLPSDRFERALVYQWLFFEQYSHEPYIAVLRFLLLYAESADVPSERIEELRAKGLAALGVMESRLQEQPFLAGRDFTIADIALYAYTHVADGNGFELEPFPAVRAWLDRVARQPGMLPMKAACS